MKYPGLIAVAVSGGAALALLPMAAGAAQAPADIVAAAPRAAWIPIPADSLIVMDLSPDRGGKARRIVIQLMPTPFAAGHVANIKALARHHWWDGTSVNRVQDNYVVQWGDATEKKPLPADLVKVPDSDYVVPATALPSEARPAPAAGSSPEGQAAIAGTITPSAPDGWHERDSYAPWVGIHAGWPIASDRESAWPVHCYGMVGVGRDLSPDTGTGAELYVVIGQAPRQLDRNIALVGRIIAGIEHLSSLPRGTGALGFYKTAGERTPIQSVRLASELPAATRPRFEYLSDHSQDFARYVAARANRKDSFYSRPAGAIDICNIVPPVRVVSKR
ncbi:peptidylprolyl isomerase [Sphingomonas sp.]|uniref:peptidylprolyl isomerase n=1 Tax=Sphingomonas sp. TaxID=28214 RepID=UPI003B3AA5D5